MQTIVLTNMCMICDGKGNVVLQDRTGNLKGVSFPGGHIEKNESIVDSTIREIKEETNLDISNLKLVGIKHWNNKERKIRYIVFLFKTETFSGTLIDETSEGKVFWYPLKDINKLNTTPDFNMIIELMLNDKYNEYYFDEVNNNLGSTLK